MRHIPACLTVLATTAALAVPLAATTAPTSAAPAATPGAPGALSHFDLARKDCVGTATGRASKVWYTVAGGMLSDVYAPTIDNTNVETMQYAVTDGRSFTDLQARDMTYRVRATDPTGMTCEVVARPKSGAAYSITTRYVTDPSRASVVMSVSFKAARGLKLFVRLDPTVNGNGGGGATNGGADDATASRAALTASDPNTVTNAVNRDYAQPLALALRADRPFTSASAGYAGTASDPATQLDADRALATPYAAAEDGNVVLGAGLDTSHGPVTLALGFGKDAAAASATAGASLHRPFAVTALRYARGWAHYDRHLNRPPRSFPGASREEAALLRQRYYLSVNVLKASEDKTFPGAVVASLASPWGQAISAGDLPDGKPVYFGSYREIFSRDLYEAFTGMLTAGDRETARATARFLLLRQQEPDGRLPRNSLLNGRLGQDSGGDQLDETAFPILMTYQSGLAGDDTLWPHVRAAADFLVSRGPSFGSERWEEQSGYSPSTIAAEIAGLVAAARIADVHHAPDAARTYRATADQFARSVKGWTVTTTGPYAAGRYFIRLSKDGDPNAATTYNLGNGSVTADQRSVVDAGFLELVRLGVLPASDPDVRTSLSVVDSVIARQTPSGTSFYRYGTSTAGSEDGYGDCWVADPTTCAPDGKPWPTGNAGSGHLWPVLSGERAEQQLATGDQRGAAALLGAMTQYASGVGLVPEQAWEDPALPASPYGTDPTTASIGFQPGEAAGSASPLTWAQAQQARLTLSVGRSRPVEQPDIVRARYVDHGMPAALPTAITGPSDGAVVSTPTTTVTGTTAPGAAVTVAGTATDSGATSRVATTADASGAWSVQLPLVFGANVVTAATEKGGATGWARLTVTSDAVTGTVVLDTTDPAGDDSGPGTFTYPTAGDFHAGAFDLTRFQVIDGGDTVYLRATLRDLTPTFGSALGAQLLDVYVRQPGQAAYSTAAAFASRNYTIAPDSAWSSYVEVQGFAAPTWRAADGSTPGAASVSASAATRTITISLPAATFGHPGAGWAFTLALHGQDGFSGDQARGFQPVAQDYQFGLCPAGGTAPVCSIDPATAPKVMDTITPAGVDQATELDPTRGPVTLRGVSVP